jgi:starch synthase
MAKKSTPSKKTAAKTATTAKKTTARRRSTKKVAAHEAASVQPVPEAAENAAKGADADVAPKPPAKTAAPAVEPTPGVVKPAGSASSTPAATSDAAGAAAKPKATPPAPGASTAKKAAVGSKSDDRPDTVDVEPTAKGGADAQAAADRPKAKSESSAPAEARAPSAEPAAGREPSEPTSTIEAPRSALGRPEPVSESLDESAEPREPEAGVEAYPELPSRDDQPDSGYEPEPEPHPEPPQPAAAVHYEHRPSLFIVQITPEMAPVAKVGGLADVVFGLSRELAIRGNHVEIILPKYDTLRYDHIFEMHEVYRDLWVPWYEGAIHCTVYFGFVHGRKCFFIEPHSHDNFFNRGAVYGYNDDIARYAFFSRAAIEFLWKAGKHPDILHCHDWQTALVPVFLYEIYQQLGMTHPRACLTIHNFKHQGVTGAELLRATGLHQPERFMDYNRLRDNHHANALNLLKGGIVYSNFITTVSPRYAFETKDQGQGFGLEPTLHTHHMKYGGVVNGVDYDVWNPEVDHHLPARYGLDNIEGKYDNKRALRHRLMLADNEKPIVAFIGRLDPQKGLELVRHAIFYTLERGGQFVLLGSSPDQAINNDFWGLKHMLNESPDCHLEIGFDEDLAHLIYAGADIILVPSQFEPCGLTQLIALRYGTIPVVRTVGGLADTVFDKDYSDRPLHERNGYRFDTYDGSGLESALGRALDCYYQFPEHFRELMKNAMRTDYSWNRPGQDYLNIYDFIRNR